MYHFQGRAVGEIQFASSWSTRFNTSKSPIYWSWSFLRSFNPRSLVLSKNLLAHGILHIPVFPVCLTLLGLLSVQQALVHQLLDLFHLLDLLNASSTTLKPILNIHRHPNWSPVDYMHWK